MSNTTPTQKAQQILDSKLDIKSALQEKYQEPTDVLDTYDDNILDIKTITNEGTFVAKDTTKVIEKSKVSNIVDNSEDNSIMVTTIDVEDTLFEKGSALKINVPYTGIVSANGITTNQIKAGETILGVSGKSSIVDTADANANANDIIKNKTAYINGVKITGTVPGYSNIELDLSTSALIGDITLNDTTSKVTIFMKITKSKYYNANKVMLVTENNTNFINIDYSKMATRLGITANKLKAGETILGLTGTYTSDATAIAEDIDTGKTAYVNGQKITGTSTAKDDKLALEQTLENLRQELAALTEADDTEKELNEIIQNLSDEILSLRTNISTLQGQVTALTNENTSLQSQLDAIELVLDQINNESNN